MEEKQERKTQYEKGREHALDHALALLSLLVDMYPKRPSSATIALLGDEATADSIFSQLQRFRERIAAEVRGRDKEVAA